jgi:hypothetical protein
VAAAKAAHVATAKAAHVAAAKAHMAEIPAGETSPAAVEWDAVAKVVVEMIPSDEYGTAPSVAIVVRIPVAPTIVLAGAVKRAIRVIATVRIACGSAERAANHAGRDGSAGIGPVNVAMPVSPNVMARASVAMGDIPMRAAGDPRMGDLLSVVSDGGCIRRGKRRKQRQSGRAERDR